MQVVGQVRATLSGDKREVKKPMVVIDIIYIVYMQLIVVYQGLSHRKTLDH